MAGSRLVFRRLWSLLLVLPVVSSLVFLINNWNTGAVENMKYMFYDARRFNQNINNWNTSAVTDMTHMFSNALAFNQNISGWSTTSIVGSRPPLGFDSGAVAWSNAGWRPLGFQPV